MSDWPISVIPSRKLFGSIPFRPRLILDARNGTELTTMILCIINSFIHNLQKCAKREKPFTKGFLFLINTIKQQIVTG